MKGIHFSLALFAIILIAYWLGTKYPQFFQGLLAKFQ